MGHVRMSIRDRLRYFLVQISPALAVVFVFIAANLCSYYEAEPPLDLNLSHYWGFPCVYRFDYVSVTSATHITTYDEYGLIANIGVGVVLALATLMVSILVRQRTIRAPLLPKSGR
jgi:hypothetical protein